MSGYSLQHRETVGSHIMNYTCYRREIQIQSLPSIGYYIFALLLKNNGTERITGTIPGVQIARQYDSRNAGKILTTEKSKSVGWDSGDGEPGP